MEETTQKNCFSCKYIDKGMTENPCDVCNYLMKTSPTNYPMYEEKDSVEKKSISNLSRLFIMNREEKINFIADALSAWAGCPDSYIYDLTRVKSAFSYGTMDFEDFHEWDCDRIHEAAEEFVNWLEKFEQDGV